MSAALIVIDVQRALFETSPPPADADAVLERINALADRARAAGAPVIYVQHETRDGRWPPASLAWTWIYGSRRRPATGACARPRPTRSCAPPCPTSWRRLARRAW